jgi:GNAT superfamily N-acetyltransferase
VAFLTTGSAVEPSTLRYEKLSSNLTSATFDCTEADGTDPLGLQDFITREAMKYQDERLGVTYVWFQDTRPAGFLTVSMTSLPIAQLEAPEMVAKVQVPYPALLLGRLAVDKRCRRQSIGTFLCQWAIGLARDLSTRVGCRYVALHTLSEKTNFYTQDPLNFVESSFKRPDGKRLLYRRIAD